MGVLTKSDKEWLYQQRQHTWPYGQQTAVAKALAKAHGLLFTEELRKAVGNYFSGAGKPAAPEVTAPVEARGLLTLEQQKWMDVHL